MFVRVIAISLSGLALASCATTPKAVYAKPGVAPETALSDRRTCDWVAVFTPSTPTPRYGGGGAAEFVAVSLAAGLVDGLAMAKARKRCMRDKGYVPAQLTQAEQAEYKLLTSKAERQAWTAARMGAGEAPKPGALTSDPQTTGRTVSVKRF